VANTPFAASHLTVPAEVAVNFLSVASSTTTTDGFVLLSVILITWVYVQAKD
jgi:hypothetical protein